MTAMIQDLRGRSLVVGVAGMLACAAGAVFDLDQFFRSYLVAYVFWLGVALGCLAILMIQHITGGAWGAVIRRLLEAGARTLPLMALLFVPLLAGMRSLYPWARPDLVAADDLLRHKQAYLNVGFFLARAVLYFAAWSVVAWRLTRMSRRQDAAAEPGLTRRLTTVSAGGLLVFVATMTFASVDWVMSIEPRWTSTIFGPLLMSGQAVSAFCFVIAAAVMLARRPEHRDLAAELTAERMHDLGKLLFAFVMVWAYFALSQFLIIWSGNLPEEIPWYLRRMQGGWQFIGIAIMILHFGLPFSLLLMRRVKRDLGRMARVALLVLVMRFIDSWWMIAPAFGGGSMRFHWMDLAAAVGVGGLWIHLYLRQLAGAPLLPRHDPALEAAAGA